MKLLVDGLDIPRWVIVVFLACWAPALCFLLLALSPFYVALLFTCFIINVIRAARFTPIRTWRLIKAISAHVGYVIYHLPRLASIAGYYYLCSPRDGVRKDVPYALRRNPTKDSTASAILKDGAAALGIPSGEVRYLLADVYFHTAAAARVAQPTQHGTATDDEVSSPTAATTSSSSSSCDVTGTSNKPRSSLAPVIVFVYGGAWGSGQRWYYSHFAAALRAVTGSVVVVPEYSTYPEGDMTAMVSDIHNAVLWTQSNVGRFGGDAKNISLIGHSAGAHLIALYLVRHAMHIAKIEPAVLDDSHTELGSREPLPLFNLWPTFHHRYPTPACADLSTTFLERSAEQHQRARLGRQPTNTFNRVILLSGVYDLIAHFEFETARGVEEVSPMRPATAGKWAELSPTHLLKSLPSTQRDAILSRLPAMSILHAETDTTVDVSQSQDFAQACARASSSDIVHHVDHASIVMDVRYRWAQTSAADHPTLRAVQSLIGGTL